MREQQEGPEKIPGPSTSTSERCCLRGGVHLAVDLLHEGLAILALLLVGPDLFELLDGEVVELLGDVGDRQPVVVVGPVDLQDSLLGSGLAAGLPGPLDLLLGLPSRPLCLLGGLLDQPQALPCRLLGHLHALLGGLLDGLLSNPARRRRVRRIDPGRRWSIPE